MWPWVCTWIVPGEGWGERQEQEESVFTEDCSSEVGPWMHSFIHSECFSVSGIRQDGGFCRDDLRVSILKEHYFHL